MRGRPGVIAATAATIITMLCTACTGSSTAAGAKPAARGTASGTATASSAPPDFTEFVGTWDTHSGQLVIRADGHFTVALRTYAWCSDSPQPCDKVSGSTLIPGDRASGQLSSAAGDQAVGEVTRTTDPAITTRGRVILRLHPQTDSVTFAGLAFCGADAPVMTCGA